MVLGIYGAGGLGKEIFDTALNFGKWEQIIFIDDFNPNRTLYEKQVISFDQLLHDYELDKVVVIIGVGEPSIRAILLKKLKEFKISLVSIVHPNVIISPSSEIGSGVYIGPFSFISSESIIEDNVLIQPHAMIGHDVKIGFSSIISTNAAIAGNCTVGARTYIALNVSVEQNIIIGDDSIIGMASCVNKDIPSEVIAIGYPARVLKKNDAKQVF